MNKALWPSHPIERAPAGSANSVRKSVMAVDFGGAAGYRANCRRDRRARPAAPDQRRPAAKARGHALCHPVPRHQVAPRLADPPRTRTPTPVATPPPTPGALIPLLGASARRRTGATWQSGSGDRAEGPPRRALRCHPADSTAVGGGGAPERLPEPGAPPHT